MIIYGCGSFFFKEGYGDIDLFVSAGRNKEHMDRLYELAGSFTQTFGTRIHPFGNPRPRDEELILLYCRDRFYGRRFEYRKD